MPWFHSFSVSIYCIILPCRCSQHNFPPSFSHIVTSMSSTKALFTSIFLIIALLLLTFAAYQQRTSLPYRRAVFQRMPEPIPPYLIEIYPKPGSFLGWDEVAVQGCPCITFHGTDFLGQSYKDENPSFDMFQLKLNGIPSFELSERYNVLYYISWLQYGAYNSPATDEQAICWHLPIYPDEYLAEITIYGDSTEAYQWAFTITEN